MRHYYNLWQQIFICQTICTYYISEEDLFTKHYYICVIKKYSMNIIIPNIIFRFCFSVSQKPHMSPSDPCLPSPCGLYAECRNVGGSSSCACQTGYVGSPPNCRPECTINSECPSNQACINEKCQDPCLGACGLNAQCTVFNHVAQCSCVERYNGDPFTQCVPMTLEEGICYYFYFYYSKQMLIM